VAPGSLSLPNSDIAIVESDSDRDWYSQFTFSQLIPFLREGGRSRNGASSSRSHRNKNSVGRKAAKKEAGPSNQKDDLLRTLQAAAASGIRIVMSTTACDVTVKVSLQSILMNSYNAGSFCGCQYFTARRRSPHNGLRFPRC